MEYDGGDDGEIFGWLKTVAGLRNMRHRRAARVGRMFRFALAAYNLVRMRNQAAGSRMKWPRD